MSTNKWMDKENVVYAHNPLSPVKKKEIILFSEKLMAWRSLLREIRHKQKNKYHIFIHIWDIDLNLCVCLLQPSQLRDSPNWSNREQRRSDTQYFLRTLSISAHEPGKTLPFLWAWGTGALNMDMLIWTMHIPSRLPFSLHIPSGIPLFPLSLPFL